jgi:hypothetical protein
MKPHSCNMAFLPLALAFAFALARCMSSQEVPTACRASHASSPALTVCVSPSNSSCPAQPLFPLQSLFVTVSCHVSTRQPPRSSRPPALHASSSGCRAPASLPIHHDPFTPLIQQPPQCGSFCNNPLKVALDRGLCNRNPRSLLLPIVDVKRAEPLGWRSRSRP